MAVGFRLPDGRDFDVVFASRITSPLGYDTGYRGPDGLDIQWRYERWNGAGAAPQTNFRLSNGVDLNTQFTTLAHAGISKDFSAWGQEPNNSGSAWGQCRFNRDGYVAQVSGASSTGESSIPSQWNVAPFGTVGDSYEIYFDNQSGGVSGSFGVWMRLDNTRTIGITRATVGTSNGQARWQLRRYGEANPQWSGWVYVSATVGQLT